MPTIQLKNNGIGGNTSLPAASSSIEHGEIHLDTVNGIISFINKDKDSWHSVSNSTDFDTVKWSNIVDNTTCEMQMIAGNSFQLKLKDLSGSPDT